MAWRKNAKTSKEARLGCPVCRTVSYLIVPWHRPVQGDEKLAVLEHQKEKYRATKCKWSLDGKPCPAGKHCMFDHSDAPQVVMHRNRGLHGFGLGGLFGIDSDSDLDDDDVAAALYELISPIFERPEGPRRRGGMGRRGGGMQSAGSDDEVDSDAEAEFVAALSALRGLNLRRGRAAADPEARSTAQGSRSESSVPITSAASRGAAIAAAIAASGQNSLEESPTVGAFVRLEGLHQRPDLNGSEGTIVEVAGEDGRYRIKVARNRAGAVSGELVHAELHIFSYWDASET
ncbi:unnamed protein product [Polarella glacialis]|uniref:C3H1-type domain-containing protein n=1 Tax=Polarella glacialis TaxID=89957 RepID=A0A813FGW5_POLGL|nr:unnamed protein product [Polarella glacialis]